MKFRHTIEITSRNGTKSIVNRDFDQQELQVGRGSGCNLIFESSLVSLQHFRIVEVGADLELEDLGSLSGTQINGKIVKRQVIKAGDEIKFGDILLQVFHSGGIWGVLERREEKELLDRDYLLHQQLNRLNIFNVMPRLRYLTFLGVLVVAGYYFFLPFYTDKQDTWSSGPISNNHGMIANDCQACHGAAFERVQDKKCLSCHTMSAHSKALEKLVEHNSIDTRCATCHMEHNGNDGLILRDSRICVNCHADIKKIEPNSQQANISNFQQHPEFSVLVQPNLPGGEYTKVRLNDEDNLKDNSNVKLNHEVHLKTIRGKDGPVKLDCRDCHNASPDLKTIEPINFEKHCSNCHGLEFDARLPGKNVPHGDPDVVFKFLYGEYAKLLLASEDSQGAKQTFNSRFKPGVALPSTLSATTAQDDFKRNFVEKEARNAEKLLFSKTACYLCHRIIPSNISEETAKGEAQSRYDLAPPQIPTRWMSEAIFSHGAHEAIRCDDCHQNVWQSTKTNQVLLPKIDQCRVCHGDQGHAGMVFSDCVMCHSYHDEKLVDAPTKRNAKDILRVK